MKNVFKTLTLAGVVAVMATAAFATNPKYYNASVSNLPNSGYVNVVGVVDSLDGKNRVTLRDSNGARVNVLLSRRDYNGLRVGQPLTVRGNVVATSSTGREINAVNTSMKSMNSKDTLGDGTGKRWE